MQKFEVVPGKILCLAVREIIGSLRTVGGVEMDSPNPEASFKEGWCYLIQTVLWAQRVL